MMLQNAKAKTHGHVVSLTISPNFCYRVYKKKYFPIQYYIGLNKAPDVATFVTGFTKIIVLSYSILYRFEQGTCYFHFPYSVLYICTRHNIFSPIGSKRLA